MKEIVRASRKGTGFIFRKCEGRIDKGKEPFVVVRGLSYDKSTKKYTWDSGSYFTDYDKAWLYFVQQTLNDIRAENGME